MAAQLFVPGLIKVSIAVPVAPPAQPTWLLLGYCRDGVHVTEHRPQRPVYGDEGGGPEGVPVDIQYLGEFHTLRMELYKYDGETLGKLLTLFSQTTTKLRGKIFDPGWMILQAGDYFLVELRSEIRIAATPPPFIRQYPRAVVTGTTEYAVGVNEMATLVELTCYPDATGILFTVPSS